MDLTQMKCKPCEGETNPFNRVEAVRYLLRLKTEWKLIEGNPSTASGRILRIRKKLKFKNFAGAMKFVNKVADLAEDEGHHPDIKISYNRVTISLTTHAIGGLSINDFIIASKIDLLYG